jgi:hypothetical protein
MTAATTPAASISPVVWEDGAIRKKHVEARARKILAEIG